MKTFLHLASCMAFGLMTVFSVAGTAVAGNTSGGYQYVVIKSTDGAYKEGMILDGDAALNLAKGMSVTLVGSDGAILTLDRPTSHLPTPDRTAAASKGNIVSALGAILSQRQVSTASLGVVRSATSGQTETEMPNPWAVSVDRSGTRCIQREVVVLWRNDATATRKITISRANASMTAQAEWAAGDNLLPVSGKKFRDQAQYRVEHGNRLVSLTMHIVPKEITGPAEQAAWMAQTGCRTQALAMLDSIE